MKRLTSSAEHCILSPLISACTTGGHVKTHAVTQMYWLRNCAQNNCQEAALIFFFPVLCQSIVRIGPEDTGWSDSNYQSQPLSRLCLHPTHSAEVLTVCVQRHVTHTLLWRGEKKKKTALVQTFARPDIHH